MRRCVPSAQIQLQVRRRLGDLAGIRIYKFRLSNQMYLLAYRVLDTESLKLLTLGSHENFYRDLKRIED